MLTKANIEHLDEIYDQVHSQGASIQFNQIFGMPKNRPFNCPSVRLANTQFSEALQRITRRWLDESDGRATINNADRVLKKIVAPHLTHMCWYEKNCLECHMAICPDGTVFPCDSFYIKDFSYGNIFHEPYERILSSKPRKRLRDEQRKVLQECKGCKYLDYCNGGCPTRSIFSMPQAKVRLRKDPLCAMHHSLFAMLGQRLVQEGLVKPDWTDSHRQKR